MTTDRTDGGYDNVCKFDHMIGRTMRSVVGSVGTDELLFSAEDGSSFRFFHYPDCCESVSISDIAGDLSDLVGSPIVQAEEVSSDGVPRPDGEYVESYTWTFYKFATARGSVTVRWLGESNGYYSEEVSYEEKLSEDGNS